MILTEEDARAVTEGVSVLSTSLWSFYVHALNIAYPDWIWIIGSDGGYVSIECKPRMTSQ